MKSQNFEFLRAQHEVLADLGGYAEAYAHSDPQGALSKLRLQLEFIIAAIYDGYRLDRPFSSNLFDLMNHESFCSAVPEVVRAKMHLVRKAGNDAVHGKVRLTPVMSLDRLQAAFDVAVWFHLAVVRGDRAACPTYQAPPPSLATNGKAREALEKLRLADARYQAVIVELEAERAKRLEAERKAEQATRATDVEQAALRAEGEAVAATLAWNEVTTRRRLIDQLLVEAGWDVGGDGADTEQVRQEVRLADGTRADYVMYGEDGKPVAVLEAKKTALDPRAGLEQARLYADQLAAATGQRPVIFTSNGLDSRLLDDAQGYPVRKLYGIYSPDSVAYLLHQRSHRQRLDTIPRDPDIADRLYQLEAIKRVTERFENRFRQSLIVQATGTGKTRVAVSLTDVLLRAGWAKRILFLCDRRELRRQADKVFKALLPNHPRVVIDSTTAGAKDKRIYLATYPAMMRAMEAYDVGFFDLIIVDEAHRSIYRKYKPLFMYFDAQQVGLTATPIGAIGRDTYKHFGCENEDPTFNYSYDQAIGQKYLVPLRVRSFATHFRTMGFKYSAMSEAQQDALEDQDDDPSAVEFEPGQLDLALFNRDTTRQLWRALIDEGIRDADGSRVGKTIVFARNHLHAVHLADVFAELYPQYGSTFCKVIDHEEPRSDQLIDDFKDPENDLTIAISVDMLDTGIDVPEVVNLVFAKPVRSYVKFWQMIGRGTRLRADLFGPGKPKTEFVIFDHWQNFQYFDEHYTAKDVAQPKPLLQHLLEARIALARAALEAMDQPLFDQTIALIQGDIKATLDTRAIEVVERQRELELLRDDDRLAAFSVATEAELRAIVAPLQHCRDIHGDAAAYRFDLLATRLQLAQLTGGAAGPRTVDLRGRVQNAVELLGKNQNPVKAKAGAIGKVRDKQFWIAAKPLDFEELRTELRSVMQYQQPVAPGRVAPLEYDVPDADVVGEDYTPKLEGLELVAYKHRVEKVLREHLAANPIVARLRARQPVSDTDLEDLARLVLQLDDKANVKHLLGYQPETRRSLAAVFRSLVGLDEVAVERAFAGFVHKHPVLSGQQLQFLQLLKNHLEQHGAIELDHLYEPPFTTLHADGVDGVFPESAQVDEILAIIETFQAAAAAG